MSYIEGFAVGRYGSFRGRNRAAYGGHSARRFPDRPGTSGRGVSRERALPCQPPTPAPHPTFRVSQDSSMARLDDGESSYETSSYRRQFHGRGNLLSEYEIYCSHRFTSLYDFKQICNDFYADLMEGDMEGVLQYLGFTHVKVGDIFNIDEIRSDIPKMTILYDSGEEILVVKFMVGVTHETCASLLQANFFQVVKDRTGSMYSIIGVKSGRFRGTNKMKEADDAFKPRSRHLLSDWPSIAFEVGVSESLTQLRQDARFWLECSGGQTWIVIIAKVDKIARTIVIERLQDGGAQGQRQQPVYALAQLWDAWSDSTPDPQENLAGWNDMVHTHPPCAQTSPWKGVFCNAKKISKYGFDAWAFEIMGFVLDYKTLRNSSTVGSLPPAIGNLTNLVTLDLHGNNLSGPLPKFFYSAFGFLQSIDLSDNRLAGVIPHNNTVSYRTIQTMNLSSNLFTGPVPPNFLMYLQNLVTADLSHNSFTGGLPATISPNETKILDLDFSDNQFNGSLPTMSGHRTIRFFNASGNLLSGELDTSNVPTLKTLDLSSNQFTGAIPDLSLLENIEYID